MSLGAAMMVYLVLPPGFSGSSLAIFDGLLPGGALAFVFFATVF